MEVRTIFGKPVRFTTLDCYPDKMDVNEFVDTMRSNLDGFAANMKMLAKPGTESEWHANSHYVEEWAESFLAWSEIEEARDDE